MTEITRINVFAEREYQVVVGRNLLDEIPQFLSGAKKILIIHQLALSVTAEAVQEKLRELGFDVLVAGIPDGEDAKRIEVAAFCWGILGKSEFSRTDIIIGLGGGVATDLAGFVAATWLRGVGLVLVPTTLLGMVDAAVGGKTGINTAEGKNLVGAFHSPLAVIADLEALNTLPRNDLLSGFAEIVKCGFISDPKILELIESDINQTTDPSSDVFHELIQRSVRVKSDIVSEDFRESGRREFLNYGHTLGHAIELTERFSWRHGAAVSIGMIFVAELANLNGRLARLHVDRHRSILESLGLPTSYDLAKWPSLLASMKVDKKSRGGQLRFVVLDDLAKPTIMHSPSEDILFTAFQEIAK